MKLEIVRQEMFEILKLYSQQIASMEWPFGIADDLD